MFIGFSLTLIIGESGCGKLNKGGGQSKNIEFVLSTATNLESMKNEEKLTENYSSNLVLSIFYFFAFGIHLSLCSNLEARFL